MKTDKEESIQVPLVSWNYNANQIIELRKQVESLSKQLEEANAGKSTLVSQLAEEIADNVILREQLEEARRIIGDLIPHASEVLARHIKELGETPRNAVYHTAIRQEISDAQAFLEGSK